MQYFRTIIEPQRYDNPINHEHKIMMLGSCFAENIGLRMQELKFNVDLNSFGVIFNPLSVAESLKRLIDPKPISESEIFYHDECWHSFHFHSRFSHSDKEKCLQIMNNRLQQSSLFLRKTDYLFLTFGTSWVYYNDKTGKPVSNCHKLPSSHFEKKLLTISEIVEIYTDLTKELRVLNPELKIILTISPVRHLKDGASGNQLSKSVLVVAVNDICNAGLANYFPAYEVMLDDLRDYRFYANDMVHPNELAIDYIFDKFSSSYFEQSTIELNAEIEKIKNAFNHKPINPDSNAYKKFKQDNLSKINVLHKKHAYLDFSKELNHFTN